MFDTLSNRLKAVTDRLRGRGRLSEDNIADAVRDVRRALLEADVALPVIRDFIARVRERALGAEVARSLNPGQVFIRILHAELAETLGGAGGGFELRHQPPVVILLAGLQGAGKTTTAAKLARFLQRRDRARVLLASLDTRRPAAMEQLEQLAARAGAAFCAASPTQAPAQIARQALDEARRLQAGVVILDTAGRSRLDAELLAELRALHAECRPQECLFVVDSMAGQDAVNVARSFGEAVPLTGVVLTKADGDARGGAALSVKAVTGAPILFLGTGEDLDGLEAFHPERMASRILGMGDVLSLVEQVEQQVDRDKAEKLSRKLRRGKGFDLEDLREQLQQMLGLGGLEGLLDKLPLPGGVDPRQLAQQVDERGIRRQIALIDSMTPQERRFPKIINGGRKRRIAAGAGLAVPDLNRLLKQHAQMQKMMKKLSKGGLRKALGGMSGRRGR
ncbi:MAG: signal recognition particle protein [Gammaproteobacteria bacterium]|nr:MAG: signal recognition particle protein [Gammaproteobacteria bacterium]